VRSAVGQALTAIVPMIATMPEHAITASIFASDAEASAPQTHVVAGGQAVIYSRRNPDRPERNEDAAALFCCDEQRAVLAVADGLGGQPAGDQASQSALTALGECVDRAVRDETGLRDAILNGFENANRAVTALGVGAATTLAVVEIDGCRVRPYHAGDSAILIVGQRGRIRLQSIDHSPVGYGVHAGMISERDAMDHDERHIVLNMVGCADMRIDIGATVELRPRDTLLLSTDGVTDNLHAGEIVERIRKGSLTDCAASLARLCDARMRQPTETSPSKPDDATFIAFRLRA